MKRLYCNALLELCEVKPLEKITVSDIVASASTARQTFYGHFHDINDLISYLPINYLLSASTQAHDVQGVRQAYAYALEHKEFFRQLPRHEGQNNFRESFILQIEKVCYEQYISADISSEERMRRMLAIDLYVIGVTGLFLEWCKVDLSWPLELLIEVQEEAVPSFIRQLSQTDTPG
jgi:AcrR family transcriptional regulator